MDCKKKFLKLVKHTLIKFIKIYILLNIFFLDRIIWFLISILPNKIILKFIKNNIKLSFLNFITNNIKNKIRIYFADALKSNVIYSQKYSSCLSKSLTGKHLLNIFGIESKIYLGMTIDSDGKKIPHAWLIDFKYGFHYTKEYKEKEQNVFIYF